MEIIYEGIDLMGKLFIHQMFGTHTTGKNTIQFHHEIHTTVNKKLQSEELAEELTLTV